MDVRSGCAILWDFNIDACWTDGPNGDCLKMVMHKVQVYFAVKVSINDAFESVRQHEFILKLMEYEWTILDWLDEVLKGKLLLPLVV